MRNQGEALRLAEELLADIEMKRLEPSEIVLKASRLARLVAREDLEEFLALEREGYPNDGSANAWLTRADRWNPDPDLKGTFFHVPLTRIEALLGGERAAIEALKGGGNYSGEWASTAGREHDGKIVTAAHNAGSLVAITSAVVSTVYGMVVEIYHELIFSDQQSTLFEDTQRRVDGVLAEAGGSALQKIERVSDRLRDGDSESVSQAMSTCRRLIDSCADHLFPAQSERYEIDDGNTLLVGQSNVLNRLQASAHQAGIPKGRRDRLRRTLADLYDRCSSGTHADVTVQEARFVFLQTYVALGELMTLRVASTKDDLGNLPA